MKHAITNTPYFFFLFEEEQEKQNAEGLRRPRGTDLQRYVTRQPSECERACFMHAGGGSASPAGEDRRRHRKTVAQGGRGRKGGGKTCPVELGRRVS